MVLNQDPWIGNRAPKPLGFIMEIYENLSFYQDYVVSDGDH